MTDNSAVGKLFGELGIPVPAAIDPGRFVITCSRYCADTLMMVGGSIVVLEELVGSVTLTLGIDDIPAAREAIQQEIVDLNGEHGSIAMNLRAILSHFDRVQAGLVL